MTHPKTWMRIKAKLRLGTGADPRISTAEMQVYTWEHVNTNTTQTLVDAAVRLVDELPEGTPADQGAQALARLRAARRCRARRDLADHRSSAYRQERHRLADLPQLSNRARVSTTPCATARGRTATIPISASSRSSVYRAVPEREGAEDRVGIHAGGRPKHGVASCRRIFPTWPRCSRA